MINNVLVLAMPSLHLTPTNPRKLSLKFLVGRGFVCQSVVKMNWFSQSVEHPLVPIKGNGQGTAETIRNMLVDEPKEHNSLD